MGNEERAQMYLELESIVKQLKELKWKIEQFDKILSELHLYLSGSMPFYDRVLEILLKPEKKSLLNIENAIETLQTIISLQLKKADLEKKLGTKVTIE